MHKEFYVGGNDGKRSYCLDVSAFTSLAQLTATLAEVFAFADTKGVLLLPCSLELEIDSR